MPSRVPPVVATCGSSATSSGKCLRWWPTPRRTPSGGFALRGRLDEVPDILFYRRIRPEAAAPDPIYERIPGPTPRVRATSSSPTGGGRPSTCPRSADRRSRPSRDSAAREVWRYVRRREMRFLVRDLRMAARTVPGRRGSVRASSNPRPGEEAVSSPRLPLLRGSARRVFVDLGMSPLCESFLSADQLNRHGTVLPAPGLRLRALLSRPASGVRLSGRDLHGVRVLLRRTPRPGWSTRGATPRWRRSGSDSERSPASSRSPATTAICSSTSSPGASPVLGVEPAANVARAAVEKGVPTLVAFFGDDGGALAADPGPADLLVGNNVLAHVPDINDFVAGLRILLKPGGVITMEFPHLWRLMEGNQFDTSTTSTSRIFRSRRSRRIFAHTGCGSSTSRSCRRMADRCASTPATPPTTPTSRGSRSSGRRRGRRLPSIGATLVRPASQGDQARSARVPDRGPRTGQDDRGIRRSRQGQHAAELLRHPDGLPRLHRRPQPVQARPSRRERTSRSSPGPLGTPARTSS